MPTEVWSHRFRKSAFQKRWKGDPARWKEFIELRETYKDRRMDSTTAWVRAMDECEAKWEGRELPPEAAVSVSSEPSYVDASVFRGKTCSRPDAVEWVMAHLCSRDVEPYDAPSAEAWSLFSWARTTEQNRSVFIQSIYAKLLPQRRELERGDEVGDDRILELIERCITEFRVDGEAED